MHCRSVVLSTLGAILLAGASLDAQTGGRGEPQPAQYGWLSSLESGTAEAQQSGKPLMVVLRCVP